jgi:hypothetical protein
MRDILTKWLWVFFNSIDVAFAIRKQHHDHRKFFSLARALLAAGLYACVILLTQIRHRLLSLLEVLNSVSNMIPWLRIWVSPDHYQHLFPQHSNDNRLRLYRFQQTTPVGLPGLGLFQQRAGCDGELLIRGV